MTLTLRLSILFSSLALSLAGNAMADVIYSSLGFPLELAGPAVIGTTAATELQISPQNASQSFTPDANYAITGVTVGVTFFADDPGTMPAGQYSPNFNIWLYSDQEIIQTIHGVPVDIFHEPKDPIVEIAHGLVAPRKTGLVTATAATNNVLVKAGDVAWIVLTPADPYTFIAWGTVDGPAPYYEALQVEGTLVTPEPASLGLFFIALLGGVPLVRISKSRHVKQRRPSTQ